MHNSYTLFGVDIDNLVTARRDIQLEEEAERTLDRLGQSMSSHIRVFLKLVAAHQALPFPVQVVTVASP